LSILIAFQRACCSYTFRDCDGDLAGAKWGKPSQMHSSRLAFVRCLPADRQGDFVAYIVCPDFFASQTTTPEISRSCFAIPSALSSPQSRVRILARQDRE